MGNNKKLLYNLVLVLQLSLVVAQNVERSLTFVIDDTGSMGDDIEAVRNSANSIFEAVINSKSSEVEDFVLVTFNDPVPATFRIISKRNEREAFKNSLRNIYPHSGGDCEEYALAGIKMGVEKSREGSVMFVFTDAPAKDYREFDAVKDMAQGKVQINFIVTPGCGDLTAPDFKVYNRLAEATGGLVFNLYNKDHVNEVLNYVKKIAKEIPTVVKKVEFPAGTHKFNVTADNAMKELLISVTGKDPTVDVTGPDGLKPILEDITVLDTVKIVGVPHPITGEYEVEVSSKVPSTVVVSATSKVTFQHGFSRERPTSLGETTTRPIPGEDSYLAIKLTTEGRDVELDDILLIDLEGNILLNEPLQLDNKEEKFYVTKRPFTAPDSTFKVAIKGHDKTNATIIRISLTPLEPQNLNPVGVKNKSPDIVIVGGLTVNAEYDKSLQLKCKISAYPKPDVTWVDGAGIIIESQLSVLNIPYDYLSVLKIDKVNKNSTYKCKARNTIGEDSKVVTVETVKKDYFNVLERPSDKTVEYKKEARFSCKVDAFPSPSITWFKDGKVLRKDRTIEITPDGNKLIIKNMQPRHQGKYICEARNILKRHVFSFKVYITGIEKPVIDKSVSEVHVKLGSNADIACRVVRGKPKPVIVWTFKPELSEASYPIEGKEVIHFENATIEHVGTFICDVRNEIGSDSHETDLVVEYPPFILQDEKHVRANDGEAVTLPCVVDGIPTPSVRWFFNGTELHNKPPVFIYRDNTLRFPVSVKSTGEYVCEAINNQGSATRSVFVKVNVPVSIELPKQSSFIQKVGESIVLPCRADGYPRPSIKWMFYSIDREIEPKIVPNEDSGSKHLRRLQIEDNGYYTCVATNDAGSANMTYEVKVQAPPQIVNIYPEKQFEAVNKDWVLRVPCKATGFPKPVVTWKKASTGMNIASGTEWYDIDADGTLIIKEVDDYSKGTYICEAQNDLGKDEEVYEVVVLPSPRSGRPTKKISVESGQDRATIECDVPHTKVDRIRWYKDGVLIAQGELNLRNIKIADGGLYTCRVSNLYKSLSGNTLVEVGLKPVFVSDPEMTKIEIDFIDGYPATMDCFSEGNPEPQVTWWHNGAKLEEFDPVYTFEMQYSNRGIYHCVVSNTLGVITRTFEIVSRECLIDVQKDLKEDQPLLLTQSLQWPTFYKTIDGILRVPHEEKLRLLCPVYGFIKPRRIEVVASCVEGTKFEVDGKVVEFSELKCSYKADPIVQSTENVCEPRHTASEMIKIGYEIPGEFLNIYEVCFDYKQQVPLYTKQRMHRSMADVEPKKTTWLESELTPFEFNEFYDCDIQIEQLSTKLGRYFHRNDRCCFSKRQLVNPRDVLPGLQQRATFSNLNVVPQWSTCNTENWNSVEERVRRLAKTADHPLTVWTGISHQMFLPTTHGSSVNITVTDRFFNEQPVFEYFWKVVQDPRSKASLAIIEVNVPDLSASDASRYVLCPDICNRISWMRSSSWHDVSNGYTYCCSINDFIRAFGYTGIFASGFDRILYEVSAVAEHALTI